MIRLYIRHAVDDFETWRKDHEARAAERAAQGVTREGVNRGVDDPDDVTLWHDFTTPEEARAYAEGADAPNGPDDRDSRIVWFTHAL